MSNWTEFPIMSMKPGDRLAVTGYYGQFTGTVMWASRGFCSYGGSWRVMVKLDAPMEDGTTEQEFELDGNRPHKFWH